MHKIIKLSILLFSIFLFIPTSVNAHLGNGPPFLNINGKVAVSNLYNQGAPALTVGWDIPPESYLVNKPITFDIDVPVLLEATTAPKDVAKDVRIRWSFARGQNFETKLDETLEGHSITKSFDKPGSYLVVMEAKLPADSDFITIDTVQVDILPTPSYQLPSAYIYAGTQFDDPKKNVLLVSESTADSSTKIDAYLWDFGGSSLEKGRTRDRVFDKANAIGVEPVFHRIVDANGFVADMGFVVEKRDDKLQFSPFASNLKLPLTVSTYQEVNSRAGSEDANLSYPIVILLAIGVLFAVGGIWFWFLKKK